MNRFPKPARRPSKSVVVPAQQIEETPAPPAPPVPAPAYPAPVTSPEMEKYWKLYIEAMTAEIDRRLALNAAGNGS